MNLKIIKLQDISEFKLKKTGVIETSSSIVLGFKKMHFMVFLDPTFIQ